MVKKITRCGWGGEDPLMLEYHDTEWGEPLHDEQKLFEFLILEGFQAGLSWKTILHKRDNFRKAFDNFDYHKIAKYSDKKLEELQQNSGIIRNRLKIAAAVSNAKAFLKIQKDYSSFDNYLWAFVDQSPIQTNLTSFDNMPAKTPLSEQITKDLKKHGFKFVGPTIVYAFMQAIGMVNDHLTKCFRHSELHSS